VTTVAVVTGGAGAIGGAIATALRAGGHTVAVIDRAGDPPVNLGRHDQVTNTIRPKPRSAIPELDPGTWRGVQAVNVQSDLWLAQAFVPAVWDPPAPDLLAYVASKAALIGIGRTLSRALGRDGITVNCVAPGLTPTPAAVADTPPEAFAQVRARQAIDRSLTPDDIAAAVAFLVSDAAGAITGQTLCADGGLVLR
jgi:NAD(P)-dependent dehydrogenase (short-subunit alcohol dehydrogenase family)